MNTSCYTRIALLSLLSFLPLQTASARIKASTGAVMLAVGCVAGATGFVSGQVIRHKGKAKKHSHLLGNNEVMVRGVAIPRERMQATVADLRHKEQQTSKKVNKKMFNVMAGLTGAGVGLALVGGVCFAIAGAQNHAQKGASMAAVSYKDGKSTPSTKEKPKELLDPCGLPANDILKLVNSLRSSQQGEKIAGLESLMNILDTVPVNDATITRIISHHVTGAIRSQHLDVRRAVYKTLIKAVSKGYCCDADNKRVEVDLGLQLAPCLFQDLENLSDEEQSLLKNMLISFGDVKTVCQLLESDNKADQERGMKIINWGVAMPGAKRGDADVVLRSLLAPAGLAKLIRENNPIDNN